VEQVWSPECAELDAEDILSTVAGRLGNQLPRAFRDKTAECLSDIFGVELRRGQLFR
jgi:hypothetical protein